MADRHRSENDAGQLDRSRHPRADMSGAGLATLPLASGVHAELVAGLIRRQRDAGPTAGAE